MFELANRCDLLYGECLLRLHSLLIFCRLVGIYKTHDVTKSSEFLAQHWPLGFRASHLLPTLPLQSPSTPSRSPLTSLLQEVLLQENLRQPRLLGWIWRMRI